MHGVPEPKPAAWRHLLRLPPVRLLLLGGPLFLLMAVGGGFVEAVAASPVQAAAVAAAMAALGLAFYAGFVRLVEARPVRELALAGMGRELGLGALVGAGLYTACVLILMALGIYRIEGLNPWSFLLPALAMALSSGIFEELVFRGALFRITEEWLGSWIALVVSALVFGLVHLINPAATLTGALFISVEAGLLLAAAYMLTRRLWLSIGFHMAWNYTQSAIFSGIVSGNAEAQGLIRATIEGPVALTGGSFGVEASVIAFVLCTATGLLLLAMAVRRGRIVPPPWTRTRGSATLAS
jgi:membrane protease YdiL (CAAX protease family)